MRSKSVGSSSLGHELHRAAIDRIFAQAYIRLGKCMKTKAAVKPEHIFRALSDETRLRILNLLRTGELCVCDLVTVLDVPQPTASRHLAYLRNVGLVTVRKEGVWCYYSASSADSEFAKRLWACVASCCDASRFAADLQAVKKSSSSCCK